MRAARHVVLCATLAVALPGANAARAANPDPLLVVLGEPRPPADLASLRGSVTLTYGVVEVFGGEPGAASIIVRHDNLDPSDRARLGGGERAIVVAKPDPGSPGRWLAPAPIRATEHAVSAFRRWGAPDDVREARPLAEIVAEASREVPGGHAGVEAAMTPIDSPAVQVESEDVLEREAWPSPPAADRIPDEPISSAAAEAPAVAPLRVPEPASARAPTVPRPAASPSVTRVVRRVPVSGLVPSRGPGLPPVPSSRPLVSQPF
jgi:hypothetical protein